MNQDTTMSHDDQLAIVLGQRQLMAVCCMFLVVIGLVSTLSYVAGRSITAAQFRGSERAETPAPIIVDPTRQQSQVGQTVPSPVKATAQTIPPVEVTPAPAAEVMPAKPSPFEKAAAAVSASAALAEEESAPLPAADPGPLTDPPAGQSFYQVGSVERPMATVFASYLTEQGFRIRLAPGTTAATVRVLAGPLADAGDAEKTRVALQAAGFQHFLKKY